MGKTGCWSGKKLIFWKVAIYHLWGTFITFGAPLSTWYPIISWNLLNNINFQVNLRLRTYFFQLEWHNLGLGKNEQNVIMAIFTFLPISSPKTPLYHQISINLKFFSHKMWQKEHFLTILPRGCARGPLFQGAKTSDFGPPYLPYLSLPKSENRYSG